MIPALGVNEPYASAVVHGLKRWETRGQPPNGEMRPDGVRGFPGVRLPRGGRIMVVANAKVASGSEFGEWDLRGTPLPVMSASGNIVNGKTEWCMGDGAGRVLALHPGHIVGSVTVTDAVPIDGDCVRTDAHICVDGAELTYFSNESVLPWTNDDISDQLPWGDWTAGRWAWQLADPKTTNEMCPVCEGRGKVDGPHGFNLLRCSVCRGDGQCDPIPVRGHQGLRPLKPEQFL